MPSVEYAPCPANNEPYTMDIRTSRPNRPGPDLRIQGLSTGRRRGPPCAPFAPVFWGLVVQTYLLTMNDFVLCISSLCATYVAHGRATYPTLVSARAAHRADRIKRHRQNRAEIGSAISGHHASRLPGASPALPSLALNILLRPACGRPSRGRLRAAVPCSTVPYCT